MLENVQESLPPWLAQTLTDITALSDIVMRRLRKLWRTVANDPRLLHKDEVRQGIVVLYTIVSVTASRLYYEEEEGRADEGQDMATFADREAQALVDPDYADLRIRKLIEMVGQFTDRRAVFADIVMDKELWENVGFEIIQAHQLLLSTIEMLDNVVRLVSHEDDVVVTESVSQPHVSA